MLEYVIDFGRCLIWWFDTGEWGSPQGGDVMGDLLILLIAVPTCLAIGAASRHL